MSYTLMKDPVVWAILVAMFVLGLIGFIEIITYMRVSIKNWQRENQRAKLSKSSRYSFYDADENSTMYDRVCAIRSSVIQSMGFYSVLYNLINYAFRPFYDGQVIDSPLTAQKQFTDILKEHVLLTKKEHDSLLTEASKRTVRAVEDLTVNELISLNTATRAKLKQGGIWAPLSQRPGWDEYWSFIAYAVSLRGSCMRRRVGAVFVDVDNNQLSTGYNGKGSGLTNCSEQPCAAASASAGAGLDGCEAIHAEVNALLRCKDPQEIHTVYVTVSPCVHCVNILLNTSAKRIVFTEEYAHNDESKRRWLAAGREWTYLKPGE